MAFSTATIQYVWSPVYVDALVLRDRSTQNNGTLDERLWVQQDANWNVTALVNGSGSVVERYIYDPYGQVTYLNASFGTIGGSAFGWLYGFQGLRLDPATGNGYARDRDYRSTLARFLQNDSLRFAAGDTNLYRFVGDNPAGNLDPSGLDENDESFWSGVTRTVDKKARFYSPAYGFFRAYNDNPGNRLGAMTSHFTDNYCGPTILFNVGKGYVQAYNEPKGAQLADRMDRVIEHHFSNYSIAGNLGRGIYAIENNRTDLLAEEITAPAIDLAAYYSMSRGFGYAGKGSSPAFERYANRVRRSLGTDRPKASVNELTLGNGTKFHSESGFLDRGGKPNCCRNH